MSAKREQANGNVGDFILTQFNTELEQNNIVKSCIKCMEEVHDKAYNLEWNGKSVQARELIDNTKENLMYEYPIYMQYVSCCLLLKQYGYGNFNTSYNTEVTNFIKKYYNNKVIQLTNK